MSQSSDLGSTAGFSCAGMSVVDFGAENDAATAASLAGGCVGRNNRSASRTRSMNWSSNEGSSCDTMSVALSEMPDGGGGSGAVPCRSPDHLVNRKALLERIGIEDNGGCRPGIRDGIQLSHYNLKFLTFPNSQAMPSVTRQIITT